MATHKLKINFCDTVDMLVLPDVGKKTAKSIAKFREREGNISADNMEYIPKLRLSKRLYESIDFIPNPQYDYSPFEEDDEAPKVPSTKGGSGVDVIDRLTQVISARQKSPKKCGHLEETPTYGDPSSRAGSDKMHPRKRLWGSLKGKGPVRTDTDGSGSDDSDEDFYDNLRGLPYSRKSGMPKFKPTSMPKTLCYDGKNNWDNFKRRFLQYAKSSELSWKDCQDVLCWTFTGKAADYYALITEMDPDADVATIFRKMEKRFGLKELPETSHARFQQANQLADEELDDWADRILTLAGKAFKHLPEKHMMQQAIVRFCQGCHDKEAGQSACNSRPRTMEQALDHIRWFQYVHQTMYGKPRGVKEVRTHDFDTVGFQPHGVSRYCSREGENHNVYQTREDRSPLRKSTPTGPPDDKEIRLKAVEEGMAKIMADLEKMATEVGKLRRPRSPSPNRGPLRCFNCGEEGHFKRDCEKPKKEEDKQVTFSGNLNPTGSGVRA